MVHTQDGVLASWSLVLVQDDLVWLWLLWELSILGEEVDTFSTASKHPNEEVKDDKATCDVDQDSST